MNSRPTSGRLCPRNGAKQAWDDVNDSWELPIKDVENARAEEMTYMKAKVIKVVKRQESYDVTGRAPISTKWVDTDK